MVNKVILIGNLGSDPQRAESKAGLAITSFSVATSETWTKNGQKETQTEWHKVVCFGKLAEICAEYLEKGSKVYVEGKIQTRKWETKEGEKRSTTEIIMREMKMLSSQGAGKDDASKAPF